LVRHRHWLHVCCTALFTLLLVSRHRGSEGTKALGILGTVRTAIHDNYPSYFTFDCAHGLCNAHHQRELVYIHEELGQRWAKRMIRVLLAGKELKERYHPIGKRIPQQLINNIKRRYRAALEAGFEINAPPPQRQPGQRGRIKRGKARNLLERLRDREDAALHFLEDPAVPWENNQAERDLRMAKVQQKVSGGFRTEAGAQILPVADPISTPCASKSTTSWTASWKPWRGMHGCRRNPWRNQGKTRQPEAL